MFGRLPRRCDSRWYCARQIDGWKQVEVDEFLVVCLLAVLLLPKNPKRLRLSHLHALWGWTGTTVHSTRANGSTDVLLGDPLGGVVPFLDWARRAERPQTPRAAWAGWAGGQSLTQGQERVGRVLET